MTVTGQPGGPTLVPADGFGCDQNMWRLVLPVLVERFKAVMFDSVGSDPSAWGEPANSFCATDPAMATVFARTTFLSDSRADLASVTVPALVLECAQDVSAPREVGAYVHASIPGSRLVTLAATGHCPQLSAPEAVARQIAAFAGATR